MIVDNRGDVLFQALLYFLELDAYLDDQAIPCPDSPNSSDRG